MPGPGSLISCEVVASAHNNTQGLFFSTTWAFSHHKLAQDSASQYFPWASPPPAVPGLEEWLRQCPSEALFLPCKWISCHRLARWA